MAHLGTNQTVVKFRLSAKDAASLKKIARTSQLSMSDVIRLLIRRERVATSKIAKGLAS